MLSIIEQMSISITIINFKRRCCIL